MTYDPDRDARAPQDVNPNIRPHERNAAGAWFLGMLVLVVLGGLVLFSLARSIGTARHDREASAPSTTGSGSGLPRRVAPD